MQLFSKIVIECKPFFTVIGPRARPNRNVDNLKKNTLGPTVVVYIRLLMTYTNNVILTQNDVVGRAIYNFNMKHVLHA